MSVKARNLGLLAVSGACIGTERDADGDFLVLWPIPLETVYVWDVEIEDYRIVTTM